jgi:predicted RNA-binding Zn-ribbon protein involved in translation (DUF1610 family)
MTSPAREATRVRCPGCGTVYDEWWHATLDLALEERESAATAVASSCPRCGHEVPHETLVADEDGVLELAGLEAED